MGIAIALFCMLFCAMLMRMKGGGIIRESLDGKTISSFGFAVLVFAMSGKPILGLAAGAAWFIGCSPAVRDYLTNLGGYKGPLSFYGWGQHKIVVRICHALADVYFEERSVDDKKLRQFYGWAGTFLRGLAMAIPLGIVFASPFSFISGAVMPVAYWFGMSAWQWAKINDKKNYRKYVDGWSLGEWFWGGAIGLGVAAWHSSGGETWIDF